jgi:large subunit ribosomal protein L25
MPEGNIDVLIHEVQVDRVTDEPIHADFLAIDMKKKIRVKVPFIFEGVSNAVKSGIGNLVKVLYEVEIEALPVNLPHNLIVDISKLETLKDQVFISDIKLPAGIVVINNPTDVVCSIIEQVEEKEEVIVVPADLSTIEVEKKGKKEEGESETENVTPAETAAPVKEEKTEKK